MKTKIYFKDLLSRVKIEIDEEKIDKLLKFLYFLMEKNENINLTAIREEKEIIEKHFIDSLFLTKLINDTEKNIIDVGTGAGFPGLVLAIFYPEKNFLLVDSVKKKIAFIEEVIELLNLDNVKVSTLRAENLVINNREKFDLALCRGLANLRIILEYMIPFIKVNSRFLPQKLNTNEVEESKNSFKELDARLEKIHKFNLPIIGDERIVLEIRKLKLTSKKFPRAVGMAKKKPL